MEREIELSIRLITMGFESEESKIKELMRGYSLINAPVIDAEDIGNCYDHVEELIQVRLVPAAYIKGTIEVDKVMPYQKQQFMDRLKWIALNYRGWKTLDFNHFRDVLLDYFRIEDSYNSSKSIVNGFHAIEYVLASTKTIQESKDIKYAELGATNLREALKDNNEGDILMEIEEANAFGNDEKVRILKEIQALTTELELTDDSNEIKIIRRKLSTLRNRLSTLSNISPIPRRRKGENRELRSTERKRGIEQKRRKGLKEIFEFYSKQHLMLGKRATFEMIEKRSSLLSMGEFIIFCKDFYIPLSKVKCAKVYKLSATRSKEMDLDQFIDAISKLFIEAYKEEIEKLEKRLIELKKISKLNKQKKRDNSLNQSADNNFNNSLKDDSFEAYKELNNTVDVIESSRKEIINKTNDIAQSYGYPKSIQRSIGGNPVNPQTSLRKQVAAEKEFLEKSRASTNQVTALNTIESQGAMENSKEVMPINQNRDDNNQNKESDSLMLNSRPNLDQTKIEEMERNANPIVAESQRIKDKIKFLKDKLENYDIIKEEGMQHIQIDYPSTYRK